MNTTTVVCRSYFLDLTALSQMRKYAHPSTYSGFTRFLPCSLGVQDKNNCGHNKLSATSISWNLAMFPECQNIVCICLSGMEKDWSFLVTEQPERLNKPETLESIDGSFSWAFVTAWLIELTGNATHQQPFRGTSVVPVLSVQQVIDHADVSNPKIDPQPFVVFKRLYSA